MSFRSNTIAVVEANADKAVPWTKPEDLQVDFQNPLAGLGDLRPDGFQALLLDASTRFISNKVDLDVLWAIFTRAGGEAVRLP